MPEVARFLQNMIPRIKLFTPIEGYQLIVTFDDGRTVRYDVADDISEYNA